jgi:hypothetical protein
MADYSNEQFYYACQVGLTDVAIRLVAMGSLHAQSQTQHRRTNSNRRRQQLRHIRRSQHNHGASCSAHRSAHRPAHPQGNHMVHRTHNTNRQHYHRTQ